MTARRWCGRCGRCWNGSRPEKCGPKICRTVDHRSVSRCPQPWCIVLGKGTARPGRASRQPSSRFSAAGIPVGEHEGSGRAGIPDRSGYGEGSGRGVAASDLPQKGGEVRRRRRRSRRASTERIERPTCRSTTPGDVEETAGQKQSSPAGSRAAGTPMPYRFAQHTRSH